MPVQKLQVMKIRGFILAGLALLLYGPLPGLSGQDVASFQVEENIRAEPQGVVLGRVLAGTEIPVLSVAGDWVEVQMEGWIWTRSIQATDRLGFDLVVAATPQENLRSEPSGEILARLVEGTLLDRVEDVSGWTRIRRAAWVWSASVEVRPSTSKASSSTPSQPASVPSSQEGWWRGEGVQTPILSGPDGDTLAVSREGTQLRVLAREGNWIRVRLEGWSWAPEGAGADSPVTEMADLTPEEVVQNPDAYRGETVTWDLQFVSVERAEKVRTDFYEGEPFLLTRTGSGGSLFVYVAVPPDRLGEVENLTPLEKIRVVGRVRAGAAALTGNPILDLLEINRFDGN